MDKHFYMYFRGTRTGAFVCAKTLAEARQKFAAIAGIPLSRCIIWKPYPTEHERTMP